MRTKWLVGTLLCLAVVSSSATQVSGADLLFIVNDPTLAAYPNDALLKNFFESLGHTVTCFDDNESQAAMRAAAAAADLVWISESVGSANVNMKITGIATPMVVGEVYAWDEMGMTLNSPCITSDVATTDVTIVNPGHFMAAGLRGTVPVLTKIAGAVGTAQFANGRVGGEGTVIATATLADGQTWDVILVYEKGARLAVPPADGSPQVAADIRIGMFFHYYAHDVLNENAYALIKAAVDFALGLVTPPGNATQPYPADGVQDVLADVVLSWTPGIYADQHDVYVGTNLSDINDAGRANPLGVLASQNQGANTYDPAGLLEFGRTYYWRVDEVNAPPSSTIFKGAVWSFTVEPYGYPVKPVKATVSTFQTGMGPEKTIDGSGLVGDLHGTEPTSMWMSAGVQPHWIQYEFDQIYKLHQLIVWNSNQLVESFLGLGAKTVTIETSTDGTTWTVVADVPAFAQAPGLAAYAANTTVNLGGVKAKYVKLTITANWGGMAPQTGLAEVQFSYVPVQAFGPQPVNAATGVAVDAALDWRPGREATSHKVFFGADQAAVAGPTAPVKTVTEHSYTPDPMALGTTYYWRVDEVGETGTYAGEVWSFTTQQFKVVDDFESYTDKEGNRIYEFWIDGFGTTTNGSQVGNLQAPFAERTIVHGGRQSMPLAYDNAPALSSEATLTLAPAQDWTASGIKSLSLWFQGTAGNGGQLYVRINDTKVLYDGDAADLARATWQVWNIDLSKAGQVNRVRSLTIGVEGNGAKGLLYIDDIRLYPKEP
jgi:hypothetical protein